jgi:nicotinate phosphoribosyltransferase family protein
VFRRYADGLMSADIIAAADEELEGEALLVPAMRDGVVVRRESLEEIRRRCAAQLATLPERLRRSGGGEPVEPHPVSYSARLRSASTQAR